MQLDISDKEVRVRITPLGTDRSRFTVDYPRAEPHRSRVLFALARLIHREAQDPREVLEPLPDPERQRIGSCLSIVREALGVVKATLAERYEGDSRLVWAASTALRSAEALIAELEHLGIAMEEVEILEDP